MFSHGRTPKQRSWVGPRCLGICRVFSSAGALSLCARLVTALRWRRSRDEHCRLFCSMVAREPFSCLKGVSSCDDYGKDRSLERMMLLVV
ncbi:hypothetical protein CBR_g84898 [Chara braunii]|uniref:Uncharacterized protein n=1 Tax=Chara braunii TaxID=69332 RepID=A0A388KAZ6_CHABU|nr:hypothetical protein CBR_g84898 [Chara braunii]|eukprot:GBG67235.1 hypothetical protein CBR_g84898 [Chara braunii]